LARSTAPSWASCWLAKASSSRARHHVQHVGEVHRGAQRIGEGLDLLHELGYSISLSAPLRLAICRPAWNSP
jgi:hypothetical protein